MDLLSLGEDILLRILLLCDVYTVLRISMVNKPLRQVTLVKQLWLSLICDPTFRTILELPPPDHEELGGLTAAGLMDLVKSAAIGPARWTPGAALPHSHITFNTHTVPSVQAPRLLPGARYMVLRTMADLHIYSRYSKVGKGTGSGQPAGFSGRVGRVRVAGQSFSRPETRGLPPGTRWRAKISVKHQ
ncbi:hypothetical protein B0H13DRAFT_1862903 [Mycena leptocephala]|nr:hypothetical protein B0H13DRAFT_1862903 [Mycena leptocephala]